MKTLPIVLLFLMTGLVGTALVCLKVTDPEVRAAAEALANFKEQAWNQAQKGRIFPVEPSGYIVSMVAPALTPAERAQIAALEQRHTLLLHRRAMADWLVTRGLVFALGLAGFCWFFARAKPDQTLEPAAGLVPGSGSSHP